jgi:uncharacterized protein YfaS (alpha-2-macroglobulin family)
MKPLRIFGAALVAGALLVLPFRAAAQSRDLLRVLRFDPAGTPSPADSLVIAFDHPVAPRLDRSIDPELVVRVTPAVAHRAYWRDPSTIVVTFDEPWPFDARFSVAFDRSLHSTSGAPLAPAQDRSLQVRAPGLLVADGSRRSDGSYATLQRPFAIYEAPLRLDRIAGRSWIRRWGCAGPDSIPLVPQSIAPLDSADLQRIPPRYDEDDDDRVDSRRRIVRFAATAELPRDCQAEIDIATSETGGDAHRVPIRTAPTFRVDSITIGSRAFPPNHVALYFSLPVTEEEIRRAVKVDGHAVSGLRSIYTRVQTRGSTWLLTDSLLPGQIARVEIDGGIRDAEGETLGASHTRSLSRPHSPPAAFAPGGPVIVPRDAGALVAVSHVNTDSVAIEIARVPDSLRIDALRTASRAAPSFWTGAGSRVVSRTVAVSAPLDSIGVRVLSDSLIPDAWRRDPILLVRARAMQATAGVKGAVVPSSFSAYGPVAIVQRTDLGASAVSYQGMTDVWITSLRSGRPVARAKVRLLDRSGATMSEATTDQLGRARVSAPQRAPRDTSLAHLLEVAAGRDRLLLEVPSADRPDSAAGDDELDAYRDASSLPVVAGGRQLHGAAFSDRGIYRPGERVFLKGIARLRTPLGAFDAPARDSARWTIFWGGDAGSFQLFRGESERVARHGAVLTTFGTAVDTFDIPRSAALGQYGAVLALKTGAGWTPAATARFMVAEYRPTEFALTLHADTTRTLFSRDTLDVRAEAKYLFGMPMEGGALRWFAYLEELSPWQARTRGLEGGWQVGRAWWRLPDTQRVGVNYIGSDSTRLDATGAAKIRLAIASVSRTATMNVSITATDANRQTVTSQVKVRVHAADAYVGMRLRSKRWSWNVGDSIPVELLVVSAGGTRRPGARIRLEALRYEWARDAWRTDTVWRSEARSATEPTTIAFAASTAGWYELVATVQDERGRTSSSGLDLWVTGGRGANGDPNARIQIRTDRERYAPGDVATVVIDSPIEQQGWISLSRSVPLNERVMALHRGPNVVEIPVPPEAMPAAEIRVVGVAPLEEARSERAGLVSTSSQRIEVGIESQRLRVDVRPARGRYLPGDDVRLRVRVTDANGRGQRAETTIWAVDEGVGQLTGLEKPDVTGGLLGSGLVSPWQGSTLGGLVLGLSSDPRLWQSGVGIRIRGMSSLMGRMSGLALSEMVVTGYSDARPATAPVRSVFGTTPLYAGAIVTDDDGVAETHFRLPDNVTTYRLFATAVTSGIESGSGDTTLVSTRPLIVRASLPRVVRLGDTLLAGGVMTQDKAGATPVSLRIEGRGVAMDGPTALADTLRDRKARELRFPMHVVSGDSVTVVLRGGSASDGDAVQVTLPVSPAGHARAHVVSGTLEGRVDLALPAVEGIDVARSRVTVQLGSSLLPLARQLSEALRVYPYDCTEQLSSAGRALIARLKIERAIDPAAAMSARDRQQLESIVTRLVARQRDDGGFGYWSREGWTSPWLTAYALSILLDAREAGVQVPAMVVERAKQHLVESARPDGALVLIRSNQVRLAHAHDALPVARLLRRLGSPSQWLERMIDGARGRMSYSDRLELALLRTDAGDTADARALVHTAWSAAQPSGRKIVLDDSTAGWGWLFESRLRPMAKLLEATAILEPRHPLLGALLESVVQRGRAERGWWWNTVDQSVAADAFLAARSVYGFGSERRVDVTGPAGTLATSRFTAGRADSLELPLASLLGTTSPDSEPRLSLVADTKAPVYYATTLFETPKARPVRADDEGISLERWYESYDGSKPLVSVREGELVRVRLRVRVKGDRDFVAVEDPLPAGLEAVDATLRTSSAIRPSARELAESAKGSARRVSRRSTGESDWWAPWEHKEKRDDRVLYFARSLRRGSYDLSYLARATTVGTFVRPPAHAEEMYNPAVHGRSDGGVFTVTAAQ